MLAPSKQSVRRSSAGGDRLAASHTGTSYSYTANALNQYTAVNTEQPTYDADGNMLTRDGWTQVWNGENRLIETSRGNVKLQFAYDYMGRRVEKKVYSGTTLTQHTRFVYDGFKLAEELNALSTNAVLRRYSWQPDALGLDVPLSVFDASANASYSYTTDANKNIAELTDANGNVVAHYEYSPFGMQTKATGTYAGSNPFRFSSEYFDAETGLVYYNYRYYDAKLGRWLSRDPIAEEMEMYLFNYNNPVLRFDALGNKSKKTKLKVTHFYKNLKSNNVPDNDTTRKYGGFTVKPEGDGKCCCSTGRNGRIVLVQLILRDNGKWEVDADRKVTQRGYREDHKKVQAYTDPDGIHPGGMATTDGIGFVDVPLLMPGRYWAVKGVRHFIENIKHTNTPSKYPKFTGSFRKGLR